jgi:CHASE2 domain-containing sensor protein
VSSQTTQRPLTARQRRRVTAKLLFLLGGTVAFLLSVALWFLVEDRETAIYVGLWVPSLFSLGALVVAHEGER